MTRLFDRTFWGLTIGLVALFALNFLLEEWMRTIGLQTLSRGLVAIGLLILWRAGLVSFGHALFFGFGAYTVAMLQIVEPTPPLPHTHTTHDPVASCNATILLPSCDGTRLRWS